MKNTYKIRAEILIKHFSSTTTSEKGGTLIDCQTTAPYLYKLLLEEFPSFKQKYKCSKRCKPNTINFPVVQMSSGAVLSDNYNDDMEKEILIKTSGPCRRNCSGTETITVSEIGK